jgi:glycosyltransferase involved in cell wall biosynthesis
MSGAVRTVGKNEAFLSGPPPGLCVLIPTFRRAEKLRMVLDGLGAQKGVRAADYQVVVCDDGSGDETEELVQAISGSVPFPFAYAVLRENGGPARARNVALNLTRSRVILIIGDDIIPAPDLVARHLEWHLQHPEEESALLGLVVWPPGKKVSPFMRWLAGRGQRFYFQYEHAADGEVVDGSRFYTANVSVKRSLLVKAGGFDEGFRHASHEDIELGHRLGREGMRLSFSVSAVGWHDHELTVSGMVRRVYQMGYCSTEYWRRVPDVSAGWKRAMRGFLRAMAGTAFLCWVGRLLCRICAGSEWAPRRWSVLLELAYWRGVSDATRALPAERVLQAGDAVRAVFQRGGPV